MNRKRQLTISAAAAVLSCVLVFAAYELQLKQLEGRQKVRVVVPKHFIEAGTRLEGSMLETKPMLKAAVDEELILDQDQLLGLETLIPLGKGEPIRDWKLSRFSLLPHEDQLTFQIPEAYVLSISNGIRAGDRVVLYISSESGASGRLFAEEVTVASVKSADNVEVDDSQQSNLLARANGNAERMYASRKLANGAIQQVNLNLSEAQWAKLDQTCRDGKTKLIIAFSPASIVDVQQEGINNNTSTAKKE